MRNKNFEKINFVNTTIALYEGTYAKKPEGGVFVVNFCCNNTATGFKKTMDNSSTFNCHTTRRGKQVTVTFYY